MNEDNLNTLLQSEVTIYEDLNFIFSSEVTIDFKKATRLNHFNNCYFKGTYINFTNLSSEKYYNYSIIFENCTFEFEIIKIEKNLIDKLLFDKCKVKAENLDILNNEITHLEIKYSKKFNCKLRISNNRINKTKLLSITNNKYIKIDNSYFNDIVKFSNLNINKIIIHKSKFNNDIKFNDNIIIETKIINNKFNKTDFSNNNFGNSIFLNNNEFNGTTLFYNLKNIEKTELKIISCKFLKYTYFNNSELNHLEIDTSKFLEVASFQETNLNTIRIDRTIFSVPAFFDEITINIPQKCSKRTFRIIKQQLLSNHNQIDFNIFKSYELNAHRLELITANKRWFNDKDAFILGISKLFSNNGLNWIKALFVTLLIVLLFYSLLYWIKINNCNFSSLNFNNFNHFFNGFTRYLIPTNMHSPFDNKKYINGIAWLPFILGKIFLAIGIYETIKSFRKYKVASR